MSFSFSDIKVPDVRMPELSSFSMPEVSMPDVSMPDINLDEYTGPATAALAVGSAVVAGYAIGKFIKDRWFDGNTLDLGERTKKELYAEARRHDIEGRSKMNKGQLVAALQREVEA